MHHAVEVSVVDYAIPNVSQQIETSRTRLIEPSRPTGDEETRNEFGQPQPAVVESVYKRVDLIMRADGNSIIQTPFS